jgi:thiamine-monophosphate kinase
VSVQALGLVVPGTALQRSTAEAGDLLFVSGNPGDAAAGLQLEMGAMSGAQLDTAQQRYLRQRFLFPEPRIALGQALRGLASACIDVSDGLAADAGKLAAASGCGVRINIEQLPVSAALRSCMGDLAVSVALTGGDDYELCFTVPPSRASEIGHRLTNVKFPVTCIGVLEDAPGVRAFSRGRPADIDLRGFDHFP